jgi:hypothetical protein
VEERLETPETGDWRSFQGSEAGNCVEPRRLPGRLRARTENGKAFGRTIQ